MHRRRRLAALACPVALIIGTLVPAAPAVAADSSISSSLVQVQFDPATGLPAQYTFPTWSNAWLRGNDMSGSSANQLTAASRNSSNSEFSGANSLRFNRIETPSSTQAKVFYDAYWSDGVTRTASLAIQYDVSGANVAISLQDVTETSGYQLISVNLPSLLSVRQEDGGSPWILDANGGGRLNPLANAGVGDKPRLDTSPDDSALGTVPYYPVDAVGTTGATGSLELKGYLTQTFASVYTSGSNKHYTAGVGAQYRVRGGSATPNIPVNQALIAQLTFAGDYDASGSVDWLDLAKTMRDQAPPIPSHYYDDKFVYQVLGQTGRHGVTTTFDQAQRLAGRISNLIDGNPQVMQFAGAYEGGHDTAEPNYTQVNSALGGPDALKALRANAANLYDTNVTFDDNYDDMYNDPWSCNAQVASACFNSADVTRTIDNQLQTNHAWNGTDGSYIAGMKKYVDSGRALARADGTITTYGLHDAALIDAMSTWALRNDWDPSHPASAVDNIVGGKFKIIDEYAKYGVAVNSEAARYPFIGKLTMAVDGPEGGGWVGPPSTEVPFMATVLRHSVIYGGKDYGNPSIPRMTLDVDPKVMLVNNNRSADWVTLSGRTAGDKDVADAYYLVYRPWMLLSKLDIDTFTRSADRQSIHQTLSDRSGNTATIDINYQTNTFSAVYNGKQIMNGYSATVPMDSTRIAFYSQTAKTLTYPLPAGADPAKVRASALYGDHRGDITATVDTGTISVSVPAGVPVIVYLDQQTPTMVNDDSAAVSYSGSGWAAHTNRGLGDHGNDVHATSTSGDSATVGFTGTGIDLLTEKNSDEGTADIYLDGQLVQSVNANASSRSAQVPLHSVAGLTYGAHTLKVVNTSSSYLLIDAFKVTSNIPPTRTVNDSNSGIAYNGAGWQYHRSRTFGDLSGDVHATTANGSSASFTFFGAGVDVLSEKNADQGDITVSVDGGAPQTVGTFAASRSAQQAVFSRRGLSSGPHTVTLTKQSGEYMLLDGFTTVN
ncbi:DUF5696 domain-containing protein [Kitasatospora sp. NPDC087314]|uniref:DUF5696 domain-containing protein n=1 Tax=Kitasatospora sp. NPDC087314 TaxID=3364068 RepID=UPI00382FCFF4